MECLNVVLVSMSAAVPHLVENQTHRLDPDIQEILEVGQGIFISNDPWPDDNTMLDYTLPNKVRNYAIFFADKSYIDLELACKNILENPESSLIIEHPATKTLVKLEPHEEHFVKVSFLSKGVPGITTPIKTVYFGRCFKSEHDEENKTVKITNSGFLVSTTDPAPELGLSSNQYLALELYKLIPQLSRLSREFPVCSKELEMGYRSTFQRVVEDNPLLFDADNETRPFIVDNRLLVTFTRDHKNPDYFNNCEIVEIVQDNTKPKKVSNDQSESKVEEELIEFTDNIELLRHFIRHCKGSQLYVAGKYYKKPHIRRGIREHTVEDFEIDLGNEFYVKKYNPLDGRNQGFSAIEHSDSESLIQFPPLLEVCQNCPVIVTVSDTGWPIDIKIRQDTPYTINFDYQHKSGNLLRSSRSKLDSLQPKLDIMLSSVIIKNHPDQEDYYFNHTYVEYKVEDSFKLITSAEEGFDKVKDAASLISSIEGFFEIYHEQFGNQRSMEIFDVLSPSGTVNFYPHHPEILTINGHSRPICISWSDDKHKQIKSLSVRTPDPQDNEEQKKITDLLYDFLARTKMVYQHRDIFKLLKS